LTDQPRPRRIGRIALLLAALALAGSGALLTWWMTTLSGLPDIGDPFDVAAFAGPPIPDEENAFVLYRQAVERLPAGPSDAANFDWAEAGAAEKGWLERSREALELWRKGTERTQALYLPPQSLTVATPLPVMDRIRWLMRLAKLDATRLEADGDLEGAWRWYRAIFRSSRHIGRHATAVERAVGLQMHSVACRQMTRWSKDPRVTPALLRRALDAAIADYAETCPNSDMVKVEYLTFLKTYDDPSLVRKCLTDASFAGPRETPWIARNVNAFSLARSWMKEPERSRRVTRLIYANLLAACDLPPDRRPPVACSLPNLTTPTPTPILIDLYRLDASAPPSARALPPEKILDWFRSTLYASRLTPALRSILKAVEAERATQANLLVALANRLSEIERGKAPDTVEELVGPYLNALPEGYKPYTEPNPPRSVP
jgi:hypothetical protein